MENNESIEVPLWMNKNNLFKNIYVSFIYLVAIFCWNDELLMVYITDDVQLKSLATGTGFPREES